MRFAGAGKSSDVQLRRDRWEDGVAALDLFQGALRLRRDRTRRLETAPGIEQGAELLEVRVEALFRIIARVLGGDEELPVRRFQQQQLAAELARQARSGFVAAPAAAFSHLLYGELCRVNVLPRPRRVRIQPDFVRTVLAPRAFRQPQIAARREAFEVFAARDELHPRARPRVFQRDALQPLRPLEPPVAE